MEGFAHTLSTLEGILGMALLVLMVVGAVLKTTKSHWVLVSFWTTTYLYQQFIQGALAD